MTDSFLDPEAERPDKTRDEQLEEDVADDVETDETERNRPTRAEGGALTPPD
jgi:hypothetical protein